MSHTWHLGPAHAEGWPEYQAAICTLPDDLAKLGAPHPLPPTQPIRAGSPSYGTWSPDGKLLACTQFERTGILGSSLTATAVLVSANEFCQTEVTFFRAAQVVGMHFECRSRLTSVRWMSYTTLRRSSHPS